MKALRTGFTLLEIMIVVAIIGIVLAIAIPSFLKSGRRSQRNTCIANLKLLVGAMEEAKCGGLPEVAIEDLVGPEKFMKSEPVCPTRKQPYTELDPPTCPTLPDEHTLENI